MEDNFKNVEAYSIQPKGKNILLVGELKPLKSASGDIYHCPKTDETIRKGTILAVGEDVKTLKKGDRVLYFYDKVTEVEAAYRSSYNSDRPGKYMTSVDWVIAEIKAVDADDYAEKNNVVRCLRPEAQEKDRIEAVKEAERKQSMRGPSNILRPGRG